MGVGLFGKMEQEEPCKADYKSEILQILHYISEGDFHNKIMNFTSLN